MTSFRVTLDRQQYDAKPSAREVTAITRRMQVSGSVELDETAFCEAVRGGRTWCGGCFEPKRGAWGEFVGQQIFALDFDNAAEVVANGQPVKDADGHTVKRALRTGEVGYLDPVGALDRCERLSLEPLCLYFTMSAQCPDWPRFRVVFDMGELLDQDTAQGIISSLLTAFPEADQACRNVNRLFYGGNGEVWETWRVWGGAS